MIPYWMSRTELLFGSESIQTLMKSHVLVVGLGGVGAIAAEMICRAGVGKLTIVDADVVEASNRNRQVPALLETEGREKAEVMAERLKAINPEVQVNVVKKYIRDEAIPQLLDDIKPDYVLDAIDTLSPKVFLILNCLQKKIPIISSMGAGGKCDPSKVRIADISASRNCKLARYVRKRLHKFNIFNGLTVVYSEEKIEKERVIITPEDDRKKSVIGTVSFLPAIFGCFCASVIIRDLTGRFEKPRRKLLPRL
jgi:tRNA A37 threonylcarbamoyladenosine dehydratase